jgi:p-hydroxybenzoate 3-monooxygenase
VNRTQVGIVGAGPAGLTLAQLLQLEGIDSVVLENRSRAYVEARIRAGVLEHDVAELFDRAGVGERMRREGLVHTGVELQSGGVRHRIDFERLVGKSIVVYGQTEIVKDLIEARLESGGALLFDVDDVSLHDLESDRPRIRFVHDGADEELECDVVAGCDGFHGISRASIPPGVVREFHREYPYG